MVRANSKSLWVRLDYALLHLCLSLSELNLLVSTGLVSIYCQNYIYREKFRDIEQNLRYIRYDYYDYKIALSFFDSEIDLGQLIADGKIRTSEYYGLIFCHKKDIDKFCQRVI